MLGDYLRNYGGFRVSEPGRFRWALFANYRIFELVLSETVVIIRFTENIGITDGLTNEETNGE